MVDHAFLLVIAGISINWLRNHTFFQENDALKVLPGVDLPHYDYNCSLSQSNSDNSKSGCCYIQGNITLCCEVYTTSEPDPVDCLLVSTAFCTTAD